MNRRRRNRSRSTPATQPDTQSGHQTPRGQRDQPPSQEAPVFNLEGTESESNAIALGAQILPAMPDNRFRNRPPAYPVEAEMRGQHGDGGRVLSMSRKMASQPAPMYGKLGVDALDQAAVAAVRKWHFHPAMKAGQAIPFDMPFRFIFEPN